MAKVREKFVIGVFGNFLTKPDRFFGIRCSTMHKTSGNRPKPGLHIGFSL